MSEDFWEEDSEETYKEEDFERDCEDEDYPWDDYCYECGGYGDDYSVDENEELVCNCLTCPFGDCNEED